MKGRGKGPGAKKDAKAAATAEGAAVKTATRNGAPLDNTSVAFYDTNTVAPSSQRGSTAVGKTQKSGDATEMLQDIMIAVESVSSSKKCVSGSVSSSVLSSRKSFSEIVLTVWKTA